MKKSPMTAKGLPLYDLKGNRLEDITFKDGVNIRVSKKMVHLTSRKKGSPDWSVSIDKKVFNKLVKWYITPQ